MTYEQRLRGDPCEFTRMKYVYSIYQIKEPGYIPHNHAVLTFVDEWVYLADLTAVFNDSFQFKRLVAGFDVFSSDFVTPILLRSISSVAHCVEARTPH